MTQAEIDKLLATPKELLGHNAAAPLPDRTGSRAP
jgi:hypothetical protein